MNYPVITLDGPGGAGKGTISRHVAETLGWHLLDSGAIYRLAALSCRRQEVAFDDESRVAELVTGFRPWPTAWLYWALSIPFWKMVSISLVGRTGVVR